MDQFVQFTQGLDQLGAVLRQIEQAGIEHRDRMIEMGWSEESATDIAVERVKLMQGIIISMGAVG